ncbi:hypothetical protein LSCM1_06297 [Leishmania martiniquensis]|uniref:Uncharacterized protein n=1 Tax=Leishmania martiniquensis TaxID=1580590 RepID=A0A836KWG4_9TRYP|nr:hypothetical protein LSCM1_06297 [Leishmania martiniquensis]
MSRTASRNVSHSSSFPSSPLPPLLQSNPARPPSSAVPYTAPPASSPMQPSALAAGLALGPQQPVNQRQIVPLMGSSGVVAQPSVGFPETAPRRTSYTANLEAQVRVLEQEVHLLRAGLTQNERLRHVSTTDEPLPQRSSSPPPKRVHFGPSSVVVPSQSPRAARASSVAFTGVEGRLRLAFGQRVDPTSSRTSAHSPFNAASLQSRGVASLSKPSRRSARCGSVPPPSTAPATTTTFVHLSPAPASLRGGNTNGVPLQGAATGGTLVSPTAASIQPLSSAPAGVSSTSPAAATVWASADPKKLWPRVATAAAEAPESASDLSRYPFRTTETSSPVASFTPVSSEPSATSGAQPVSASVGASSAAASPIVVAMSSDGPPLTSLTQPGTPTVAPASEAMLPPTAAPVAPSASSPPTPSTALAVTHPLLGDTTLLSSTAATNTTPAEVSAPPVASSSASVAAAARQPETEVLLLRDTLAQREALLHRVLLELHDRHGSGSTRCQSSPAVTASEANERQQSRQAMRLLAEELLAVQTQLSHARISHQLVVAELHTCREQMRHALSPEQQRAAAPEKTSPAEASQPSPGSLQEQLGVALSKVQAWEEWYATSVTAAGDEAAGVTAGNSNALSIAKGPSSPPQPSPKLKTPDTAYQVGAAAAAAAAVSGAHEKKRSRKRDKHLYETSALSHCPQCGLGLPGLAPACAAAGVRGDSPTLPPPSALALQGWPAVAPSVPYVSAYAFDSILLHHLASRRNGRDVGAPDTAGIEPGAVAKTSGGGAATPPPPEDASLSPSQAQIDEVKGRCRDTNVLGQARAGTREVISHSGAGDASSMWAVPMNGSSITCASGASGGARQRVMSAGHTGGGAASSPCVSYCDRLDHAQQQAYRAQRYIEQLARGAAVRELAEAERQVAEKRLSLREHHLCTKDLTATSQSPPSLVLASSAPDGPHSTEAGKQEVVE